MPGDFLPPVITRLSMNIDDFVGGIAKAKAALKGLPSNVEIDVKGLDAAIAKMETFKDKTYTAALAQATLSDSVKLATEALRYQWLALSQLNPAITSMSRRAATAAAAQGRLKAAISDTTQAMAGQAAMAGVRAVSTAATGGGGNAGGFRPWGIPINGTTLHWLIAGSSELLAVAVPALVAVGAAAMVSAEGWGWLTEHIKAAYIASEAAGQMFGKTTGNLLGLKSVLQQAQTAMDPAVFSTFGSGLYIASQNSGLLVNAGKQLTLVFQTFAAKLATEFAPGGSLSTLTGSLLSNMVSDATQFGQVFGNLGHGLATLGNQMPGIAELILSLLAGFTGLASKAIQLGSISIPGLNVSLITLIMGFEETSRYSHLVASGLSAMGIATKDAQMGVKFFSNPLVFTASALRTLFSILPNGIALISRFLGAIGMKGAATNVGMFASSLTGAISGLGTFSTIGIGAAIVGLSFFILKLDTARSGAQQFTDQLQRLTLAASNMGATEVILKNINAIGNAIRSLPTMQDVASTPYGMNRLRELRRVQADMRGTVPQLNAGLQQQYQDLRNLYAGASQVAQTYGISLTQAMYLADAANVKLASSVGRNGQLNAVALMQIKSLVMGYQAMGQSTGEVGADMTALAIQSGVAASKVSQLNSAWDEFMTNLTGGTSGLASLVTSISNIGQVVGDVKNNLGKASNISLTTGQFAQALTTFGTTGASAWTNFNQVVGSTIPQLIDWLRIAGTEGAIDARSFSNAILGMISQMVPFAAKSKTAQAELLGLAQQANPAIQTWGQLTSTIKNGKLSLSDTANAIQTATQKMGNMAAVGQQLGTVLQSALITTMDQAKIAASGVNRDMQNFLTTLMNGEGTSKTAATQYRQVMKDLENLGYSAKQAAQLIQMVAGSMAQVHSKTVTLTVNTIMNAINPGGVSSRSAPGVSLPGHAMGTPSAQSGWAWVGEMGPELVKFRGGETVIPNHVARGYAGGAGDIENHVHVYLDGRKIYRSVQKNSVATQRRTGTNGLSRRTR